MPFVVQGEDNPDGLYQELAVFVRYSGAYRLDQIGQAISLDTLFIQNQQEFEAFATKIPVREIVKFNQYKTSLDSLTQELRFDWDRLMMLVVFDEYDLSSSPNVTRVEVQSNQLLIVVEYSDIAYGLASMNRIKPLDIGVYSAVLVAKSFLPLQWRLPSKRTFHQKIDRLED